MIGRLNSFLGGIDGMRAGGTSDSKSQGGGLYCWSNLEICKNSNENLYSPDEELFIVEFESELTTKLFEIDYELGFNQDNKLMKHGQFVAFSWNLKNSSIKITIISITLNIWKFMKTIE